jgi:hypothetical protein
MGGYADVERTLDRVAAGSCFQHLFPPGVEWANVGESLRNLEGWRRPEKTTNANYAGPIVSENKTKWKKILLAPGKSR